MHNTHTEMREGATTTLWTKRMSAGEKEEKGVLGEKKDGLTALWLVL